MGVYNLSDREFHTVLAALRCWQQALERRTDQKPPPPFDYIASDDGSVDPLSPAEIDTLCEELNGGDRDVVADGYPI